MLSVQLTYNDSWTQPYISLSLADFNLYLFTVINCKYMYMTFLSSASASSKFLNQRVVRDSQICSWCQQESGHGDPQLVSGRNEGGLGGTVLCNQRKSKTLALTYPGQTSCKRKQPTSSSQTLGTFYSYSHPD